MCVCVCVYVCDFNTRLLLVLYIYIYSMYKDFPKENYPLENLWYVYYIQHGSYAVSVISLTV